MILIVKNDKKKGTILTDYKTGVEFYAKDDFLFSIKDSPNFLQRETAMQFNEVFIDDKLSEGRSIEECKALAIALGLAENSPGYNLFWRNRQKQITKEGGV